LKIAFLKEWGQIGPKFQVQGLSPTNHFFLSQNWNDYLSYGVRILAEVSFALSQFTRLTDRQTGGQSTSMHSMQCSKIFKRQTIGRLQSS